MTSTETAAILRQFNEWRRGLDIRGASLSSFMTDVHSALEKSK